MALKAAACLAVTPDTDWHTLLSLSFSVITSALVKGRKSSFGVCSQSFEEAGVGSQSPHSAAESVEQAGLTAP
jgi:hypothetical protein